MTKFSALRPGEREALDAWHAAWRRLEELGWQSFTYAPHDGSEFLVLEVGSCGVFRGLYSGKWPDGVILVQDGGEHYPVSLGLWRKI